MINKPGSNSLTKDNLKITHYFFHKSIEGGKILVAFIAINGMAMAVYFGFCLPICVPSTQCTDQLSPKVPRERSTGQRTQVSSYLLCRFYFFLQITSTKHNTQRRFSPQSNLFFYFLPRDRGHGVRPSMAHTSLESKRAHPAVRVAPTVTGRGS